MFTAPDGGDLVALSYTGQQPLHLAALAGDIATLSWLEEQGVVRRRSTLPCSAVRTSNYAH